MHRIRLYLAILPSLLLLSIALADPVLYESDNSLAARSQLTIGSEGDSHRRQPNPDYPIAEYGGFSSFENFDPLEELRSALDVMQTTWFQLRVGTWPTAIDWTRAVLDTYLVSVLDSLGKAASGGGQLLRDQVDSGDIDNDINKYFSQNVAYYFGEDGFSLRNQAFDDMLWVVLGWLESVKFIKSHCTRHLSGKGDDSKPWYGHQFIKSYSHQAHIFYSLATRGWDTELCGGGMVWNPYTGPYKNAITNELFIAASVGMYLYFPGDNNTSPFMADEMKTLDLEPSEPFDPKYLRAAVDGYAWLKKSNMTNSKGLYTDGFHISNWKKNGTKCDVRNDMIYTYNQAVILSGLRGLWESTGNRTYLEEGHELARNAIKATGWDFRTATASDGNEWAGLGRNGILEDRCDASGHCDQDAQTFKGIFFHHLTLFCEPLPITPAVPGKTHCAEKKLAFLHRQSCREYSVWTAHNAQAALASRDKEGRFGMWWGARNGVESEPLAAGAIDYRNDASELLGQRWRRDMDTSWSVAVQNLGSGVILNANGSIRKDFSDVRAQDVTSSLSTGDESETRSDPNDRHRGRTVETQGGGVAVLRALVELLSTV